MENSNNPRDGMPPASIPQLHHSLLRSLPIAYVALDLDFCIREFSESWLQLMSKVMDREITQAEVDLADYRSEFNLLLPLEHEMVRVLSGENPEPWTLQVHKHTSDEHWVNVTCSAWKTADGEIAGSIAAFYDITSLSKPEQFLRMANEELLQFNYHVSHDLVAPIASARGLINLIQSDLQAGEMAELPEMLTEAREQLDRLDRLVVDLMALARADARTNEITEFDLTQLIDDIAASLALKAREIDISITLKCDLPRVVTDRVRVQQILTNLISNAKKFIDPNEPAPDILISSFKDNQDVVLRVSDNGLGIEENIGKKLFGIFERGSSEHSGHGLGLYIVLKHAKHLGGTIKVVSYAKPTVFELRFPEEEPWSPIL